MDVVDTDDLKASDSHDQGPYNPLVDRHEYALEHLDSGTQS
jgi:hypothetical protein